MFILNIIIVQVGGTDGIAIFTSAWRIIMLGIVPLVGIAIGVTAVTAAAFGARDIDKLQTAYLYGIKLGVFIEIGVVVLVVILAPQLSYLFTYSKDAAHISADLIKAFRSLVWFLPTVPMGMLTSSMFQGVGKGAVGKGLPQKVRPQGEHQPQWVPFLRQHLQPEGGQDGGEGTEKAEGTPAPHIAGRLECLLRDCHGLLKALCLSQC